MSFIKNPKDFWAGMLYMAFGLAAILIAYNYPVGTAGRMGPGYFPRILGAIMIGIGVILALRGVRVAGARIAWRPLKPLVIVLASIALFALVAPYFGMVAATVVLVVVASTASHEFRWKEAIIASVLLAAFAVAAFGYGLNLQLPLWPAFLG
ncbi:MAG: tripartite tricarboxylate transporter TctB family protein [Burkholderiales bacterium]|nr:tripartite tricarboxylate transporter TctB family protein [Burkholderiales bacterium]